MSLQLSWIEQRPSKPQVEGSNPPRLVRTTENLIKRYLVGHKQFDKSYMVGMVQLVSAPDCGSGYHGFESHYPPFFFFYRKDIIGLSPSGKAQDFDSCIRRFESNQPSHYGCVAQVVEHLTFNQVVRGSNPRTLMKETAQFYDYGIVLFLYVVIKVTE